MILKNSSILVKVEEALVDLIVVSYSVENKKFEGVLLDTQKGNLPFGVYNLHPAFSSSSKTNNEDKLYSVNQRFAYNDDANPDGQLAKKPIPRLKLQQKQKMTVRLRPRKVLCSNCKGICNENNQNVDLSKKRKLVSDDESDTKTKSHNDKKFLMQNTLIPKLSRLQPQEISNAIKGNSKTKAANKSGAVKASEDCLSSNENMGRVTQELTFVDVGDDSDKIMYFEGKTENVGEKLEDSYNPIFSSARTLKICYGEGEGTVVKIPASLGDFNEDSGVSFDISKPTKQVDCKAVKKALKKAKKQQKKLVVKRKLPKPAGALSPRNNSAVIVTEKEIVQKKHKKKYKEPKKLDENLRFNKKKKGSYKEAVKQATVEAKKLESHLQDPLASPTSLPTMSPRPINVFS